MMNEFTTELTNALRMTMGDLGSDLLKRASRTIGKKPESLAPDDFEPLMVAIRDLLETIYPPDFCEVVVTKVVLAIKGRY